MALDLLFALIAETTSGEKEIVAGVADLRIMVMSYGVITDTDTTLEWRSASTPISGLMKPGANGGISASGGCFATAAGEALQLSIGDNAVVGGHLMYRLVP